MCIQIIISIKIEDSLNCSTKMTSGYHTPQTSLRYLIRAPSIVWIWKRRSGLPCHDFSLGHLYNSLLALDEYCQEDEPPVHCLDYQWAKMVVCGSPAWCIHRKILLICFIMAGLCSSTWESRHFVLKVARWLALYDLVFYNSVCVL
jgi:hypothetical protein